MFVYLAFQLGTTLTIGGVTTALLVHGGWQSAAVALAMLGGLVLLFDYIVAVAVGEALESPRPRRRRRDRVARVTPARTAPEPSPRAAAPAPAEPRPERRRDRRTRTHGRLISAT